MQDTEKLQLFAVAGNPISHSLSPQMMNKAMESNDFNGWYMRLAADSTDDIINTMEFLDMSGCNITAPFKIAMFEKLNFYDMRVREIGATNVVIKGEAGFVGYNTDVNGIYQSLSEYLNDFQGLSVLIIGYGGAARAAAYACRSMQMQEFVTGKDLQKIDLFSQKTGCIAVVPSEIQEAVDQSDVIISTIPKETLLMNQVTFGEQQIVLDCSYSNPNLKNKVTSRNAFYIGGEKWLLYQGAPSYKLFTTGDAPVQAMQQALQEPIHIPRIFTIATVSDGLLHTVEAHLNGSESCTFIDLTQESLSLKKLKKRIQKIGHSETIILITTTNELSDKEMYNFIKNETFCFFLVSSKEKEKETTLQYIRMVDVLVPVGSKAGAHLAARIRKEIDNIAAI